MQQHTEERFAKQRGAAKTASMTRDMDISFTGMVGSPGLMVLATPCSHWYTEDSTNVTHHTSCQDNIDNR